LDINVQKGVDIVFTPRAQQYLEKNNCKEITIEMLDISSCCIPVIAPPDVRRGMPREPKRFNLIEKDGLSIYYQRGLPIKPKVTIDVQGFGFIKLLKIVDWEIKF
jgi:hypothetical protein